MKLYEHKNISLHDVALGPELSLQFHFHPFVVSLAFGVEHDGWKGQSVIVWNTVTETDLESFSDVSAEQVADILALFRSRSERLAKEKKGLNEEIDKQVEEDLRNRRERHDGRRERTPQEDP